MIKKTSCIMVTVALILSFCACSFGESTVEKSSEASLASREPSSQAVTDEMSEAEITEAEIRDIANALLGAGMLGSTWIDPWSEESVYDLSFVSFYCMMNQDYTSEIPASDFELFIQGYFDVSTDNLHQIADYNADKNVYKVSVDISVPMLQAQTDDFFRIDSVVQENDRINVSYRILWGRMAATGDGSDTAYAGIITLRKAGRFYPVVSVNVTEDYSDKYD